MLFRTLELLLLNFADFPSPADKKLLVPFKHNFLSYSPLQHPVKVPNSCLAVSAFSSGHKKKLGFQVQVLLFRPAEFFRFRASFPRPSDFRILACFPLGSLNC